MNKIFFIEWQAAGHEPVITKKETRESAHDFVRVYSTAGITILGVWAGEKWFLGEDGKIYSFNG